ncbi:hypothetical protein C0244_004809 [Escherichia coli]|nr:hypothetical protein [Escherichia coli]
MNRRWSLSATSSGARPASARQYQSSMALRARAISASVSLQSARFARSRHALMKSSVSPVIVS